MVILLFLKKLNVLICMTQQFSELYFTGLLYQVNTHKIESEDCPDNFSAELRIPTVSTCPENSG